MKLYYRNLKAVFRFCIFQILRIYWEEETHQSLSALPGVNTLSGKLYIQREIRYTLKKLYCCILEIQLPNT
jgi:hypothetical protein